MRQLIYLFLAIILLSSCLDEDDNTVVLPFKNDNAPTVDTIQLPANFSGQPVISQGTINATVRKIKVDMRDYAAQDGDVISLFKNDTSGTPIPVIEDFNLANTTFNETVTLENKGYNYLILLAVTKAQGPNTALIRINGNEKRFELDTNQRVGFNIFVQ